MFFVAVRFSLAALVILPLSFRRLKGIPTSIIMQSILLGILLFFSFAFQTAGLEFTSATKSAFITGSTVIFIPVFQILIEKRKPTQSNIIGSVIVLIGLVFLSSKNSSIGSLFYEIGNDFNYGDFLTLLCAFVFACQVVYLDKVSKKIDFIALVFIQIITTSILALSVSALLSITNVETIHINLTGNLILGLLYTSLLATIAALMIQARYQKKISPTKAGIIYSFEPVFAAIFAYYMLSERISMNGVIGCILIFSGLIISEVLDIERILKLGIRPSQNEDDVLE